MRDWPKLPWPPSQDVESSRAIGGPLWQLGEIHAIAKLQLQQGHGLVPITDSCLLDLQKLSFERDDVAQLILQLNHGHYDKSLWCLTSPRAGVQLRPEKLWYPCDAYTISRREQVLAGSTINVDYYLKFCMTSSRKLVLLLSVHLQD